MGHRKSHRYVPLGETLIVQYDGHDCLKQRALSKKACMKLISAIILCFIFVCLGAWKEAILSFLINVMLNRDGKPKYLLM